MLIRKLPRWSGPIAVVLVLGVLLLAWFAWPASTRPAAGPAVPRPGFLLSYAGAEDRLTGMGELEGAEQLRDWARTGLAADLELDTAHLADVDYDTLPVRDGGFSDLARQPVGPGRFLFADGVLHLLVPGADPHQDRTIALLLDQYRTDADGDPPRVQLHRYTVLREIRAIQIGADDPVGTEEFRRGHGYVRMRIDGSSALRDFLARTRALSTVEVIGNEVWAGGWQWTAGDGQPLTREDVAVLQRGYANPKTPAFSLDPGPIETLADLAAVVPDVRGGLLDAIVGDRWGATPFSSADDLTTVVNAALFGNVPEARTKALGLPTDRVQLWALWSYLSGESPYGQARYDGELQGTEVGMTLFYTDYVAKDWVNGVGTGVPTDAVKGFEPDPKVATPWSHCEQKDNDSDGEAGRLWFGQNEGAFAVQHDRISIGAQPTRLFAKSDGEAGAEVESSYAFGRGLRWWDQHYQEIADYEMQYQRLDQIMRWSAALEWLGENRGKLPPFSEVGIRSDLRFADWYLGNNSLRERAPIHYVTPPSAGQESVLTVPSEKYESCGITTINGGVSLGDLGARKAKAGRTFQADLPGSVRRAGLYDEKSTFDPATGTGSMRQVSIDEEGAESSFRSHTISRDGNGTVRVEVGASPRRVVQLGELKVWRDAAATRSVTVELRGGHGQVSQQVRYQGKDFGGLTAEKQGELVTLRWRTGLVDRVKNTMDSVRDRVTSGRGNAPVNGPLYRMRDGNGRDLYRVAGAEEAWLSITTDAPAGTNLAFRLGVPGHGGAQNFFATLLDHPDLPPGEWVNVTAATPDATATATMVEPPAGDAPSVPVITPDGRTTKLYPDKDGVRVAVTDPVLGRAAGVEGFSLLRDYHPKIAAALKEAADAHDGMLRGVLLGGDGVVLAGADGIRLAGAAHDWAHKVARATRLDQARLPRFALIGDHLLRQEDVPLRTMPGTGHTHLLGHVLNENATVLIHEHLRSTLSLADGPVMVDALPRDVEVVVAEVSVTRDDIQVDTAEQPDIWVHDRVKWWRVVGGAVATGATTTQTSSAPPILSVPPTPSAPPSADRQPGPTRIFVVCAEDDADPCAA